MSNKSHFAIVPDSLIAKQRPEETHIYCELYMLEVSNQRYTLKIICENRNWKYNTAYRLLRLAREVLGKSRQKRTKSKKGKNENTKNIIDPPRPVDTRVSSSKTETKETQKEQKIEASKKGLTDSSQSVEVVPPLSSQSKSISESITNDLSGEEANEIKVGSVQGCAPIPEPTNSLLTYETFSSLSANAQSNYIANMGERWADK